MLDQRICKDVGEEREAGEEFEEEEEEVSLTVSAVTRALSCWRSGWVRSV